VSVTLLLVSVLASAEALEDSDADSATAFSLARDFSWSDAWKAVVSV